MKIARTKPVAARFSASATRRTSLPWLDTKLAVLFDAGRYGVIRLFAALAPVGRLLRYDPLQSEGQRGASTTMVGRIAMGSGLLFLMLCMLWWRKHLRTS